MKKTFTILIAALMLLTMITLPGKAVGQTKDPILLFHETFGSNSGSATAWNATTYSVQSGEEEVYEDAEYTVTNAKVSKNTMGQTDSGLVSGQGTTGSIIIGPLDVSSYSDIEISYYFGMGAGSWNSTYSFVKLSYLGNNNTYVELTRTDSNGNPSGAVSNHNNYKQAVYSLPAAAISDELNLKFEFYCYQINKNNQEIGQAYFDEINMTGIESTPTPTSYTVSFDCDGGTANCPDDIDNLDEGDDFTIPSTAPTKDCYTFEGWIDDELNEYELGHTYQCPASDLTITAVWTLNKYTISYSPGEGAGDAYSDENLNCGSDYTIWSVDDLNYDAPEGKPTFVNWKDQYNATYDAGDEIQVSKNLTLTAQWTSATLYAVTFNCNGDNVEGCPANMNVEAGTQITLPDAPTREGYTFNCGGWWNTSDNSRYTPGSLYTVNAAVTFRADWIENQSAPAFTVTGVSNGTTDTYYATASVSINTVSGYTYYYTTNGDEPTTSSTEYTSAIVVNTTGSTTIKAIATQYGCTVSPVGTKTITIVQPNEATFTNGVYASLNTEANYNTWYKYNVSGNQVWSWASYNQTYYAKMSGYASNTNNANEDWLISPKMTVTNGKLAVSFDCAAEFGSNALCSAQYSTNYPGYGDPSGYTWTKLIDLPYDNNYTFTAQNMTITGVTSDVYVAIKYVSTTSEASTIEINNFAAKQCYPVTYAANGGSGTMTDPNSPYAVGAEVTTLNNTFTAPTGQQFEKWSDGTNNYAEGAKFPMPNNEVVLSAQWITPCTVLATMDATEAEAVYDYNGGNKRFNLHMSSKVSVLGGCDITEYGFVYSTSSSTPTLDNATKLAVGSEYTTANTKFETSIENVTGTYYVRAFATNAAGTAYSTSTVTVEVPAAFPTWTISYTTNGDDEETTTLIDKGDAISNLLAAPTQAVPTGYTFVGWSATDVLLPDDAPTFVENGGAISGDMSLKAVFAIGRTEQTIQNKSLTLKSGDISWESGNSYRGGTATKDGISFTIENGLTSGDYIQLRKSDGKVYNTTALGDHITTITATVGVNSIVVYEGEGQNPSSSEVSIEDGVYTFSESKNYFAITSTSAYTQVYFTINYVKTSAATVYSCYCTSVSKGNTAINVVGGSITNNELTGEGTIAANTAVSITNLTIKSGAKLIVEGALATASPANLIIEDGGQLICNNSVAATVMKSITAATETVAKSGEPGWYTISSPVNDGTGDGKTMAVANVTNLITNATAGAGFKYDMFAYDEATHTWLNQKYSNEAGQESDGFTSMNVGQGYLYRNNQTDELSFPGNTNTGDVECNLSFAATTETSIKGFNLIGNPYPHSIAKGEGKAIYHANLVSGYYVMTYGGAWTACTDGTEIPAKQGILVKADAAISGFYIQDIPYVAPQQGKSNNDNIMFQVENAEYSDVAYAWFDKGTGLNKINHRNAAVPMLYIPQDGVNYAIATMSDGTKTFNLNFKAGTMGKYTLKYKTQGQYSYLHLIDRLTGNDVDLLVEDEYTFIGSPSDADNRFIVKLNYEGGSASEGDIFAYQSGDDIVVNGEGELQIFDLMGRMVATQNVNGVQTIGFKTIGVYVFKLNGMTQKIVVK